MSLPGFISAVKVSDLTHGHPDSALRLTHFRGLADKPSDPEYAREEWVDLGRKSELKPEEKPGAMAKKDDGKSAGDADGDGVADEDESGVSLLLDPAPRRLY